MNMLTTEKNAGQDFNQGVIIRKKKGETHGTERNAGVFAFRYS